MKDTSPEDSMPAALRARRLELCCKSKRGQWIPPEEMKFLAKMHKKHPEQYRAMSQEVFELTKPFGA